MAIQFFTGNILYMSDNIKVKEFSMRLHIYSTAPRKIFKIFGGYHGIWRYGEAQGVQEVQKKTFGKYSTEGIPR